jgi:hypothetical protein
MKFELQPYHRNISNAELLEDLHKVALDLKKDSFTVIEYKKSGKYHPHSIQRRFGTWARALQEAGLKTGKIAKVSAEDCITDLKMVAAKLKKTSVTIN